MKNLGLNPIKADLNDVESLKKAITDVTTVLHLAALADDWASWEDLYRVNVQGLENLSKLLSRQEGDFVVTFCGSIPARKFSRFVCHV